jgi:hypothetical protein
MKTFWFVWLLVGVMVLIAYSFYANWHQLSELDVWFKAPAANLTKGDVLLLVLFAAWIIRGSKEE